MPGRLYDTYAAALQHDLVSLPEDTHRVGVVRRQTRWFHPYVDENLPALGPPPDLLDTFREQQTAYEEDGLDDATAHNQAWDDVDYDRRYREHLEQSDAAGAALAQLRSYLEEGQTVALVCYENTDEKRCHRTILRDILEP